jgi:hypothetical protein
MSWQSTLREHGSGYLIEGWALARFVARVP